MEATMISNIPAIRAGPIRVISSHQKISKLNAIFRKPSAAIRAPNERVSIIPASFKIDSAKFWADDEDDTGSDGGGGFNGNDSGGGGDGGGDGGSNGNGDGGAGFGKPWFLVALTAAALGSFGVYQRKRTGSSDANGASLPDIYDSNDVRTLKRLLREVFSDLVRVRSRLDDLEQVAGISSSESLADASPLSSDYTKTSSVSTNSLAAGPSGRSSSLRHALSGALKFGAGALWDESDDANGAGESLNMMQEAGVRLGTDLVLQLGGSVRGGSDAILAEVKVDPVDEAFALQKVLYNCKVAPALRLILAPFGARGQDVAYTLNPFAGQGLAASVKHGNPLHQRMMGAVVGAAADLKRAWLSAAYFSQTPGDGGSSDTLFAQAVVAPVSAVSLGLTLTEPVGTGTPGSAGGGNVQLAGVAQGAGGATTAAQGRQLGAIMALAGGNMALHGWAAASADNVEARNFSDVQWGMTLAPQPNGSGTGWALGIGKVAAAGSPTASPPKNDSLEALQPNILEISTQFNLGDGLLLTPGVVAMRRGGLHTVFAGVKSTWLF